MHTLLMRLVGPMQSWGYRSRFDNRDTALEPTRSGVIGLLCAAMGIPRDQDLSRFDSLRMGVRVDATGLVMVDYHTAMDVIHADGSGPSNVVSHRYYMADARFLVGLESADTGLLREIEAALRSPRWSLFLGRKSFCPSVPIHLPDSSVQEGIGLEQALREFPWYRLRDREQKSDSFRLVLEARQGDEGMALHDWPLNFAERRFRLRHVVTDSVPADQVPDGGLLPCISPD